MGQAATDLPDPLEQPAAPPAPTAGAAASADEIISQMAGDEIERLMAAAGEDAPASAKTPPPPPAPSAAPAPPPKKESVADLIRAAAASIEGHAGGPAVVADPNDPEPIAEPPPKPAPAKHKKATAAAKAPATSPADPAVPAPSGIDQLKEAARAASAAAGNDVAPPPRRALKPQRNAPPWLIAMLQVLNSPAQGFSDTLRQALGKVALVTTFNALAVLIYVLIFRHPHH